MATIKSAPAAPVSTSTASNILLQNRLVQGYARALQTHPMRTRQATSGTLSALAEILAGHLAGLPAATAKANNVHPSKRQDGGLLQTLVSNPVRGVQLLGDLLGVNQRAAIMFLYGYFISAPMSSTLTSLLQKAFEGKTTGKDKIAQIVVSSLTVTPISSVVYLTAMAIINGARTPDKILAVIKGGLSKMLKVSWITSPLSIAFAQKFLPLEAWESWFVTVRFFLALLFNTQTKKRQIEVARREAIARGKNQGKGGAAAGGEKESVGNEEIRRRAEQGK